MTHRLLLTVLLATPVCLSAQQFRLEEIMKGYAFIGHSPENIEWSLDGKSVYFQWNPRNEPGTTPYSYDLATGAITPLPAGSPAIPAAPSDRQYYTSYYHDELGDIVRYNSQTKRRETVISLQQGAGAVQRVSDPKHIWFRQGTNLFVYDETTGTIKQATNFQRGVTAAASRDSSSLMKQQAELFSYIREEQREKQWNEQHRRERSFPKPIPYSGDEQPEDLTVSPNERFVTFRLSIYPEDPATYVEEHITPTGYTNRIPARAKVGDIDPGHRFGIYDREKDTFRFVSFAGLTDIRKKPSYLAEYGKGEGLYEKDRNIIMHAPVMHPDGTKAVMDIRSYDNKDRWIVLLDLQNDTIRELDHQHDEAWIGGPGISGWNAEKGTLGWLDEHTIYFQSENPAASGTTGYSHLYVLDIRGGTSQALTSGNWEVYDVQLSRDKQTFYLLANKIHPGVRNGYRLSVKDKKLVPLFEGNFGIEWALSPDEKQWAIRYSTQTQPWELCIAGNKPGAPMKRITHSTTAAYEELPVQAPEVVQIPASDGKEVTARLYKPQQANGTAVLFVHGAGYLQNAHYYWSYYCREMLFHQLLAQQGYTVLDIDYRASEGYGRDVRTAVYRDMGNRDLQDYIDGKNYLVRQYGIDSTRVGIYGGSYGGFITLMGMLKTPGTFACGAALRSVTDWEHYNHEYTSNILNYPGTDPKAYRRSSPIYYAEGLNGPLLLLHGMEDDNVQFQDIIRLNQRFIELGKTNYQLAVFPTEAHGFRFAPAWTDEYRRIYELFERELRPENREK
jgi:dipeptidyl aminopeptidase/acylaminoacyl peptidase